MLELLHYSIKNKPKMFLRRRKLKKNYHVTYDWQKMFGITLAQKYCQGHSVI